MSGPVLSRHLVRTRQLLLDYAEHVGLLAKHGNVRGEAREGIIRIFLEENLPSLVEFKTGELVDCRDSRSGQLDIVLQSVAAPRIPVFRSVQTTMVDAALGIIEVKSNLTTGSWGRRSHLRSALETFQKVKSLERHRLNLVGSNIGGKPVYHPNTPCFLVAYKGPTKETLVRKLLDYGEHFHLGLDEYAPEVVCVLDRSFYVYRDNGWLFPRQQNEFGIGVGDECLAGVFVYVCRIVETWNAQSHFTRFSDYLDR